jgi:hypothetical protein
LRPHVGRPRLHPIARAFYSLTLDVIMMPRNAALTPLLPLPKQQAAEPARARKIRGLD